jgi:hypothetical protein
MKFTSHVRDVTADIRLIKAFSTRKKINKSLQKLIQKISQESSENKLQSEIKGMKTFLACKQLEEEYLFIELDFEFSFLNHKLISSVRFKTRTTSTSQVVI